MSASIFPVMSFVPAIFFAVNRIAETVFAAREAQDEIILEVRLHHVEALAA